jgi:hypothetical protein
MRVSHSFPAISEMFDDPNLVSCTGLAPTMALAQRAGLTDLVSSTLTLKAVGGVNAHLKVPALCHRPGRDRRHPQQQTEENPGVANPSRGL